MFENLFAQLDFTVLLNALGAALQRAINGLVVLLENWTWF